METEQQTFRNRGVRQRRWLSTLLLFVIGLLIAFVVAMLIGKKAATQSSAGPFQHVVGQVSRGDISTSHTGR